MAPGRVIVVTRYSRAVAQATPGALFVFGDNLAGTGLGGQAGALRGEPNAVGIPTKQTPEDDDGAYFTDADLPRVTPLIDAAFEKLTRRLDAGGDIWWPAAGVGTGLAQLPARAPAIAAYIETKRSALFALAGAVVHRDE